MASKDPGETPDASARAMSELGYEDCRDELIDVVRRLEEGGLSLDESLALWERGEALAKRCEEHLAGARQRVAEALGDAESDGD
ncbi:exodeoxyribonuclease VII small subunit [Mycobacterium sp. 1274756.6]|uniref:exodeoxyribonuclease VII small subunit n=1 Tax=Mycobacterium sp. 1274756.6 TaxID=1834076 RepID=UPI0008008895|nr:exodeoxyribonuclease VII small subunit [Mycobacterium sp. 1274756.6]OBJ67882.1 exodeoxyribonuclease VII small subunit [Mycobacterium sp. 1274756.6]